MVRLIVWEDSSHGAIRISDRRLISIADCVQRMFQKRFKVSARELASLLGKIISAGQCLETSPEL